LQDPHNTLHNTFAGSQMAAALAFLSAHPGQVSPITVAMGFNDFFFGCGFTPDCVRSTLPQTIVTLNKISARCGRLPPTARSWWCSMTILLPTRTPPPTRRSRR
jgi:hypothetical protein